MFSDRCPFCNNNLVQDQITSTEIYIWYVCSNCFCNRRYNILFLKQFDYDHNIDWIIYCETFTIGNFFIKNNIDDETWVFTEGFNKLGAMTDNYLTNLPTYIPYNS